MKNLDNVIKHYISEQIALEEQLCKVIEAQIAELQETDFTNAKDLLIQTKQVLEKHFLPLNKMLDGIEQEEIRKRERVVGKSNGVPVLLPASSDLTKTNRYISEILRDDYSALNLITMGNTLLHTTALVMGCKDIAAVALEHLRNLTPLVNKIGELVPEIAARELGTESHKIDLSIVQIAKENAKLAWHRAT